MSRRHRLEKARQAVPGSPEAAVEHFPPEGKSVREIMALLSPIQREIVKLKFQHPRLSQSQIATLLGIGKSAVTNHFSRRELNELLALIERDVFQRIDDLRDRALTRWEEMLANKATPEWIVHAICRELIGPVLQSKNALPPPSEIGKLVFEDEGRPDKKPEVL